MRTVAPRRKDCPPLPPGLRPTPTPRPGRDYLNELVRKRPPQCVLDVFLFLDEKGRIRQDDKKPNRCCWAGTHFIADQLDIGESSVRARALPWLEANGYISIDEDGVIWCLWMLPFDPEAPRETEPPRPIPRAKLGRQAGARTARARGADSGAPIPAPYSSSDEEETERRKTTDREDAAGSSSSLSAAPPMGSRTAPGGPEPAPAIDPRLADVIDREIPDPKDRAQALGRAPAWAAGNAIERAIAAILIAEANRKAGRTIASYVRYVEQIMENQAREAACPKLSRRPGPDAGPPPNLPSPHQAAAARAARDEIRAVEAARLRAALAMTPGERAALEAEWERDNPPKPGEFQGLRPALRRAWCEETYQQRKGHS